MNSAPRETVDVQTAQFVSCVVAKVLAFAQAKRIPLYVVGGAVRDALLGRPGPSTNLDLAIPGKALAVTRALADALKGTYVCLDEEAGSARVVVLDGPRRVEFDISDFRGPTIEADLAKRDFTINAMAVPLERWVDERQWHAALLDPLHGRRDLEQRLLRACFPGTFHDDPVRILRAFRFAVTCELTIAPEMGPLMAAAVGGLALVSGERVRDELFAILQTDRAAWALQELNQVGALDILVPELIPGRGVDQGGYHHLDVFAHQLEAVAQGDRIFKDFAEFEAPLREPLAAYCAFELVEGRSRKALMKFAALVHDVGKPATKRVEADGDVWFIGHEHFGATMVEALTQRLRLSNREHQLVYRLVLYHLRPGHLSREPQLTSRAIFRFFRDLEEDGPACLLVWWTDRMATRGPVSRLDQIDQQRARLEELLRAYFFRAEEVVKPPRLVDGTQLMQALALTPGAVVGRLLAAIEEAQAAGELRTPEEALAFARKVLDAEHAR